MGTIIDGRIARSADHDRRSVVVETAVVAPLLVLLLVGVWTVGRAFNVKAALDVAARDGARFAASIDRWDPVESPAAVRSVMAESLATSGVAPERISDTCVALVQTAEDPCDEDAIPTGGTSRVAVTVDYAGYPLDFVAFSVPVDFSSRSVSRRRA